MCSQPDRYTYGVCCGSAKAIFDEGARAGSEVVNGRGDVVSLRATMVIAGVRRRVEMTSVLPDKAEREMLLHRSLEDVERAQIG